MAPRHRVARWYLPDSRSCPEGDRGLRTHHADGSLQFSRVGFRRDTVIVQVILGLVDAIEILGVAKLQDLAVAEPQGLIGLEFLRKHRFL